jgi:hypothetical protein
MKAHTRISTLKKLAAISVLGTMLQLPLGACKLEDFTTTTTTTLDGREVVTYLVRSAILTPIDNYLTGAINAFFDQLYDDEN